MFSKKYYYKAPSGVKSLSMRQLSRKLLFKRGNPNENNYFGFKRYDSRNNTAGFIAISGLFLAIIFVFIANLLFPLKMISPAARNSLDQSTIKTKSTHEVFGFAPHWTFNKLDNVDFTVLTTLAYFGLGILPNGEIDTSDNGYAVFNSQKATDLFKKAHDNGTRVVLTITQMDNDEIKELLDDPASQKRAINSTIEAVKSKGIDGVNVDFEYVGNPGEEYQKKFTAFVKTLNEKMHKEVPGSKVTVSVYASAVKYPKIYEISELAKNSDGIFMMAYDFATSGSQNAIPTAPLYGHKEGKYWYDISTAVDDFLTQMPKEKLILGLPWYGYNYPVSSPEVKAQKDYGYYTYYWWRGRKYSRFIAREGAYASTYARTMNVPADASGWDDNGKVGWHAYNTSDGWRMIFLDDERSLSIKYDFAKEKRLGGVGMWALGFDDGKGELWRLLSRKFGAKLADSRRL